MSESNQVKQGAEPGRQMSVEGSAVMRQVGSGRRGQEAVRVPVSRLPRDTARWVYGHLKRTTSKSLIHAAWTDWGSEDLVDMEYAYFVDLVKLDSLLQAAVLDHYVDGRRATVFRDGTTVEFLI